MPGAPVRSIRSLRVVRPGAPVRSFVERRMPVASLGSSSIFHNPIFRSCSGFSGSGCWCWDVLGPFDIPFEVRSEGVQ